MTTQIIQINANDSWKYSDVSSYAGGRFEAKIFLDDNGNILDRSYTEGYLRTLKEENVEENVEKNNKIKKPKGDNSSNSRTGGFFSKFIVKVVKSAINNNSVPNRNLQRGCKGEDVRRLQMAMGVEPDGIYGPKTEAAVKAYQKSHGLAPDGIVGPNTRGSLSISHPGSVGYNIFGGNSQGSFQNRPITRHAKNVGVQKPQEHQHHKKGAPVPKRAKLKQASKPSSSVTSVDGNNTLGRPSLLSNTRKPLVKPVKPLKPVASSSKKKKMIFSGTSSHSSSAKRSSSDRASRHSSSNSTSKPPKSVSSKSKKESSTKKKSKRKKRSTGIFSIIKKRK